MRKIKIWPAPQLELRVAVTDKMIDDYRECYRLSQKMDCDGKDCDTCSWREVEIGDTTMCELKEMLTLLEPCEGCFGAANNDCGQCVSSKRRENFTRIIEDANKSFQRGVADSLIKSNTGQQLLIEQCNQINNKGG